MKILSTRRQFLVTVGSALELAAFGLAGPALAAGLGRSRAGERLRFGALDDLVDGLQGSAPDEVLPWVVGELRAGLALSDLVAATALANARALGGTDYDGYHALMALMPSYAMARRRSGPLAALPVLKVVHRNVRFIHDAGKARADTLEPLPDTTARAAAASEGGDLVGELRAGELARAEAALAARADASVIGAFERVQELVRQDADVHRVVLSWRAYDLSSLAGEENATTLLRQELRFCDVARRSRLERGEAESPMAGEVSAALARHDLEHRERGTRRADDASIEALSLRCFEADRPAAAEAVASALADGIDPADVARAIALAATRIVLHDRGQRRDTPGKPAGSVHGANYGVHASDAANAWRHIAALGSARNGHASLVAAAYHTAGQRAELAPEPFDAGVTPSAESDAARLLAQVEGAVRERDATSAGALARRYAELGHASEPLLALLLEAMVEQDGALHAEKYFDTAREEHAAAREAHRGLHLVALARVAASGYGFPAPGLDEARQLLGG